MYGVPLDEGQRTLRKSTRWGMEGKQPAADAGRQPMAIIKNTVFIAYRASQVSAEGRHRGDDSGKMITP